MHIYNVDYGLHTPNSVYTIIRDMNHGWSLERDLQISNIFSLQVRIHPQISNIFFLPPIPSTKWQLSSQLFHPIHRRQVLTLHVLFCYQACNQSSICKKGSTIFISGFVYGASGRGTQGRLWDFLAPAQNKKIGPITYSI